MSNAKIPQANNSIKNLAPLKGASVPKRVPVVVTMDGITRSSVATIKKDMSESVKRDLKVLRQFGLVVD